MACEQMPALRNGSSAFSWPMRMLMEEEHSNYSSVRPYIFWFPLLYLNMEDFSSLSRKLETLQYRLKVWALH